MNSHYFQLYVLFYKIHPYGHAGICAYFTSDWDLPLWNGSYDCSWLVLANSKLEYQGDQYLQGLTLTVVCWPLACRNTTLAGRNLEQLAIFAWKKCKTNYLINVELYVYLTKWTFKTKNIFQVMVLHIKHKHELYFHHDDWVGPKVMLVNLFHNCLEDILITN